jgi:hypothetical protein
VHVADVLDDPAALEGDGHVHVRAAPHEALGHDPDHGAHGIVQPKLSADHAWVAAELALPEAIPEHHHRLRARSCIVARRRPADDRRHAHYVEGVERPVVASQALRVAISRPQDVADGRGDHAFEDRVPFGDLDELIDRVTRSGPALRCTRDADAHQSIDVLVRKGIQDDGVQHAVDRGRRHDPECQRQDGQNREAGSSPEPADAESNVASELLNPIHAFAFRAIRGFIHASGRSSDRRASRAAPAGSTQPARSPRAAP